MKKRPAPKEIIAKWQSIVSSLDLVWVRRETIIVALGMDEIKDTVNRRAHKMRIKTTCANCGNATTLPVHSVTGRARLHWCVGCWTTYSRQRKETKKGIFWADGKDKGHVHPAPDRWYPEE